MKHLRSHRLHRGILATVLLGSSVLFSGKADAAELRLFVDERAVALPTAPVLVANRVLVPAAEIARLLGAEAEWHEAERQVWLWVPGKRIHLTLDAAEAQVNTEPVLLDVPPRLISGRPYVPLRFVVEILGAEVLWMPPDAVLIRTQQPVSRSGVRRSALPDARDLAERLVRTAEAYLGYPYRWAGSSPETGFDCSGFVYFVAKTIGIELPRTAEEQALVGQTVRRGELQNGDLVFFATYGAPDQATHVGIYHNGTFIHAQDAGVGVVRTPLSDSYWSTRFLYGKRIVAEN